MPTLRSIVSVLAITAAAAFVVFAKPQKKDLTDTQYSAQAL